MIHPASPAAIRNIQQARKLGHVLEFNGRSDDKEIARYHVDHGRGQCETVLFMADGSVIRDFDGEVTDEEAAIERRNDERSRSDGCPDWAM